MAHPIIRLLSAVTCLSLFLLSCTEDFDFDDFSLHQDAIINGHEAPDPEYGSTVAIAAQINGIYYPYCSGVLIKKNVVLTAAHCTFNEENFDFNSLFSQKKIAVIFGKNVQAADSDHIFVPSALSIHPDYKHATNENDLALLWLKPDVPEIIAKPAEILDSTDRFPFYVHSHHEVEFVGYGLDDQDKDGVRLHASGSLVLFCANEGKGKCGMTNGYGEHMIVPEGTLVYDIEKSGPCNGDSGGPVFISIDDQKYLIGIVSYGDADCASFAVSTTPADHLKWINKKIVPKKKDDGCSVHNIYASSSTKCPLLAIFVLFCGAFVMRRKKIA